MNNRSPFAPQGSPIEQKNASRQRVRLAVYCILSVHVVGLMALLMIGCRKPAEPEPEPAPMEEVIMPELDYTNITEPSGSNEADAMNVPEPVPDTNYAPGPVTTPDPYATPYPTPMPTPAPVPAPSGQEYTIVAGDTFSGIAKKFPGVTVRQIQDANPSVQPTRLRIGQKIVIPAPSVGSSGQGITPLPSSNGSGENLYVVKSGDTLSSIARRNSTTVREIRDLNNLITDKIRVGQKLKIPVKAPVAPAYQTAPMTPTLTPPGQ